MRRIKNVRVITTELGNVLTNKERKTIRKELYDLEKQNHTKTTRERAIAYLINLQRKPDDKKKYRHIDYHDQAYYGIEDIEHLINDNIDDYYTPVLVRSSFENNFEEYEIRGKKDKNLSLKQYIATIKSQLIKLINEKKISTKHEQKVQLIIAIVFRHIMDFKKNYTFYVTSKNLEMINGDDAKEIYDKILESFFENYEREENILRNGSNFVFDRVDVTYVQFHAIQLKRGGSCIPTPEWLENKKATINPQNMRNNFCVAYALIAALHHEEIGKNPHRISKLKSYIPNYNWKKNVVPVEQKHWNIFERNNKYIALNIFSAHPTEKEMNIIRRSKRKRKCEK